MSTPLATVNPAIIPDAAPRRRGGARPELVEVTPTKAQRRARPRIVYAAVIIAGLAALLLSQLGISMVLSKGAYQLESLSAKQTALSRSQQALDERLQVLNSPQNLSRNAQKLGMVANTTPVYLDPKTGRVYGTPTPATDDTSATSDSSAVPNSLLSDVPLVASQGDTTVSKESGSSTSSASSSSSSKSSSTAGSDAENTSGSSASDSTSSGSSVGSDTNQLQAPSTR